MSLQASQETDPYQDYKDFAWGGASAISAQAMSSCFTQGFLDIIINNEKNSFVKVLAYFAFSYGFYELKNILHEKVSEKHKLTSKIINHFLVFPAFLRLNPNFSVDGYIHNAISSTF
jgi:hypothetical protein